MALKEKENPFYSNINKQKNNNKFVINNIVTVVYALTVDLFRYLMNVVLKK